MGRIILVDKPKGMTSFDVCFKLRKIFSTKKIGHTGTLDPNASGLMMILVDSATKINQFVLSADKEYVATVLTGLKTDSEDIDGEVIMEREEVMPEREKIAQVLDSFLGKSLQSPPMISAVKVDGKRLYEYHRQGIKVDVKQREIIVKSMELLDVDEKTFSFKTKVSSGTYIRTLAQDMLKELGIIGTLKDLRRTMIDDFSIDDAYSIEDIEKGAFKELDTYDILSRYYPVYQVEMRQDVINGKPLHLDLEHEQILCADGKEVLAIYKKEDGVYRCQRGLL